MITNTHTQGKGRNLEIFKWLMVAILLIVAVVGNYYYRNYYFLLRTIAVIAIIVIAVLIAMMTAKGRTVIVFIREARTEMRKVIWPAYQETLHTTLIVALVTAIMSIILWGLDIILFRLISYITALRF